MVRQGLSANLSYLFCFWSNYSEYNNAARFDTAGLKSSSGSTCSKLKASFSMNFLMKLDLQLYKCAAARRSEVDKGQFNNKWLRSEASRTSFLLESHSSLINFNF